MLDGCLMFAKVLMFSEQGRFGGVVLTGVLGGGGGGQGGRGGVVGGVYGGVGNGSEYLYIATTWARHHYF